MVTSGFYGYHAWLSVVFCGYQRLCIVTSGFYGYHGYQWLSVVFYNGEAGFVGEKKGTCRILCEFLHEVKRKIENVITK